MYRPAFTAVDDVADLVAIVRSHGFGHLVVHGAAGFDATALPVLVDHDPLGDPSSSLRVRAHVAKANPIWRATPCDALLIVSPLDAYVSPNWYATKQAGDPRVVPTWNYELIHVKGRLLARRDAGWVEQAVRDLTEIHESPQPAPWSVDDAPTDYLARNLRAIVGLELAVTSIEGKRKLSQNRAAADVDGVVDALSAGPPRSRAVAAAMKAGAEQT